VITFPEYMKLRETGDLNTFATDIDTSSRPFKYKKPKETNSRVSGKIDKLFGRKVILCK
jgi:hypothetical protein